MNNAQLRAALEARVGSLLDAANELDHYEREIDDWPKAVKDRQIAVIKRFAIAAGIDASEWDGKPAPERGD